VVQFLKEPISRVFGTSFYEVLSALSVIDPGSEDAAT
jgi:hypothetical protein